MLKGRDIRSLREEWRPPVLNICEPRGTLVRDQQPKYHTLTGLTELVREE